MGNTIGKYGGTMYTPDAPKSGGFSGSGVSSGISAVGAIATTATGVWSMHNRAKHNARMAEMNWQHNKAMVLENLKVNQYIVSRNKMQMLDASVEEGLSIDTARMQAKAEASVIQVAYGMKGGSAQQVQHSIARNAAKANSQRILELDQSLVANKMQLFHAESQAQSATGIRPISSYSSRLSVAAGLTEAFGKLQNIYG